MRDMLMFRCAIYGGGTSNGAFFRENDLHSVREPRAWILLAAFGNLDSRQATGWVGPRRRQERRCEWGSSERPHAEGDFTFGQADIADPSVDWRGQLRGSDFRGRPVCH
jgi:2-methylaconitate cis-trans-isomerase PrpF